jgi:hypothetical protein
MKDDLDNQFNDSSRALIDTSYSAIGRKSEYRSSQPR